jgi:hypothetical protein
MAKFFKVDKFWLNMDEILAVREFEKQKVFTLEIVMKGASEKIPSRFETQGEDAGRMVEYLQANRL